MAYLITKVSKAVAMQVPFPGINHVVVEGLEQFEEQSGYTTLNVSLTSRFNDSGQAYFKKHDQCLQRTPLSRKLHGCKSIRAVFISFPSIPVLLCGQRSNGILHI